MTIETIRLTKKILDEVTLHAREVSPNEMCGLMVGINNGEGSTTIFQYHRVTNDEPGPMSFLLNAKEQMKIQREARKDGCNEFVIVHSHPKGPSRLSSSDRSMAYDKTRLWFLVSKIDEVPVVQCWRVSTGGVNIEDIDIEVINVEQVV